MNQRQHGLFAQNKTKRRKRKTNERTKKKEKERQAHDTTTIPEHHIKARENHSYPLVRELYRSSWILVCGFNYGTEKVDVIDSYYCLFLSIQPDVHLVVVVSQSWTLLR